MYYFYAKKLIRLSYCVVCMALPGTSISTLRHDPQQVEFTL